MLLAFKIRSLSRVMAWDVVMMIDHWSAVCLNCQAEKKGLRLAYMSELFLSAIEVVMWSSDQYNSRS